MVRRMISKTATRKLATILAADVVGYSAQAERNDEAAAEAIAQLRARTAAIAASQGGRIFSTAGDSVMVEFSSAGGALAAAAALIESDLLPLLRVGVHVGDVIVAGNDDLLGHGVNVAARLQQAATPGEVLVSAEVRRLVRDPLAARLKALGTIQLQKMDESIEAFVLSSLSPASPEKLQTRASQEPLLAVLPFDNLSSDPEMGYFSDGVSDEILRTLARSARLRVVGRASSFQFRGADKATRRVHAALGASHVLDGSVQRAGDRVRISAQLIDARTQTALWQDRFDRSALDLFALQDEIAAAVAGALNRAFINVSTTAPIDPEAYEQFLKIREAFLNLNVGFAEIEVLDRVADHAPGFAPAWAAGAYVRMSLRRRQAQSPAVSSRLLKEARAAADRAAALDPTNPDTVAALLSIETARGNWTGADAALRESLPVAARDLDLVSAWRLGFLFGVGRLTEALGYTRDAYERDRLHAAVANNYAHTLRALGRFEEALSVYEDTCRRWPLSPTSLVNLLFSAAWVGRWDIVDKWRTHERTAVLARADTMAQSQLEVIDTLRDPTIERCATVLQRLRAQVEETHRLDFHLLVLAAELGDLDQVYELVARVRFVGLSETGALGEHENAMFPIIFDYRIARRLQSDIRFVTLCAQLGLAQYWTETNRWPDCADWVSYDFRSEAGRLAASLLASRS